MTADVISLRLPFPPSVNRYYRRSGTVIHLSQHGAQFKADALYALSAAKLAGLRLDERLEISVILHSPTRRKYDIDNRAKALLDALQSAKVFLDDEQIDLLTLQRGFVDPSKEGYCMVAMKVRQ